MEKKHAIKDGVGIIPEGEKGTTKKIVMNLYGEGARIDVFDSDEGVIECYNAMVNDAYFNIEVDGTEYSYDDFGRYINKNEWPDDMYDDDWKFINDAYKEFEGKEPCEVLSFEGCDLYYPEESFEDAGVINVVQTKVSASVTIEIGEDEEFDPKELHFMYAIFVLPDRDIEINCGVLYNGKQYAIELDIDSEREIGLETVWEA